MRPAKEYDKNYLEKIVKKSKSFREVGKYIGVEGSTAKAAIIRSNIDTSHFKHNRAYEDMIGNKYNMLKILSIYRVKEKGRKSKIWAKCLCECGKEKDILAVSIKAKRTGSCGCDKSRYIKMRGKNSSLYKGYEDISGKLWGAIKARAKHRKHDLNVDIKYAWDLYLQQDKKCALSRIPISFGIANKVISYTTASLDRIDNSKGYVKGNIQWVHKSVNIMKNILPEDVFIGLCYRIGENANNPQKIKFKDLSVNYFAKHVDNLALFQRNEK